MHQKTLVSKHYSPQRFWAGSAAFPSCSTASNLLLRVFGASNAEGGSGGAAFNSDTAEAISDVVLRQLRVHGPVADGSSALKNAFSVQEASPFAGVDVSSHLLVLVGMEELVTLGLKDSSSSRRIRGQDTWSAACCGYLFELLLLPSLMICHSKKCHRPGTYM